MVQLDSEISAIVDRVIASARTFDSADPESPIDEQFLQRDIVRKARAMVRAQDARRGIPSAQLYELRRSVSRLDSFRSAAKKVDAGNE